MTGCLAKKRFVVSENEMEMIIHDLVSPHLDYCNSLFSCLSRASLKCLQMVQNVAVRLLTSPER